MSRGGAAATAAVRLIRSRPLEKTTHQPSVVPPTILTRATSSAPLASIVAEAAAAGATVSPQARAYCNGLRHYGTFYWRFSEGRRIRLFTVPRRQLSTISDDINMFYRAPLASIDLMCTPCLATTSQTKALEIYVGNALEFIDDLESDRQSCLKDLSIENLKKIYEEKVKPALELRCLLPPYRLDGLDAASLLFSYKDRMGDLPKYMTSFDLMISLKTTTEAHWGSYLDYLSQERILVVEDWTDRLCTGSSSSLYDYGMLCTSVDGDERLLFKGEVRTSVKGEKANLSFIIRLGKKIHFFQIYYSIPCIKDDSIQAEMLAMYLLLKRGVELGLHLHKMQVCTYNELLYKILTRVHGIKDDTKAKHANHRDLFMLLIYMRIHYKDLMCIWVPREKLMFVDRMLQEPIMEENAELRSALICNVQRDGAPFHQGSPMFIADQENNPITSLGKMKMGINDKQKCCYLEVEEHQKVDAMWHIGVAFRPPSKVFVALKDLDSKPNIRRDITELILNGVVDCGSGLDYSLLAFDDSRLAMDNTSDQDLVIIFDAAISKEPFLSKNTFIVYLSTPDERSLMEEQMIPKFILLSSDHGTKENQRDDEDAKLKYSGATEEDFALKEMTAHTTREELIVAKQNDKKQLSNISRALAVLASASSGITKRQEFVSLVNKESSMLERDGSECEKAKRAYMTTREDLDVAAEESEKEIDDVNTHIMSCCQLLDRDHHGKATPQEVGAAVARRPRAYP